MGDVFKGTYVVGTIETISGQRIHDLEAMLFYTQLHF